ncbi:glycoside hydrolase family 3 N-terminal domain-containing protein [Thermotoga sp. RQ2]|uniref:glycoside hydrolase family 3 N-terminal domain-containing protein n=1 Tax=Thermotoga sp. (strain RQ2) TaxID=126740 RepID=UPI0001601D57|nr:glycoside hydrolase family 3 N-terminal domain-containing protein [Thermotoga sp. RQ2]ACB09223.1 glycoside hydrolase family 3 domain protein [Thermotoga sp. RQ2]
MEPYRDPSQPIEVRVRDLLSRMTLEEKVAQLGSVWGYELIDERGKFSREKAKELLKNGIGQVTRPGGSTNLEPQEAAELVNEIQRFLVEETRLGIPAMIHEECLTGYMGLGGTNFPQAIAMASTWDPDLIEKMTTAIREDMRKIGAHQGLAPVLDVARDPRWGRTEETFGESPYLVARMGVSYVKGLQGEDIKKGVVATVKHFAGYSASEGGKNWAPTNIPEREFKEVFLFPFEAAVKEANVLSVMNSYSEIDGVPCAANRKLLTDILRKDWGFEGIVVSDYFAVKVLEDYHRIARDKSEAARLALEAGIDVELPKTECYQYLKDLVEKGIISEALIDEAVARVLRLKFMLGLFENPYVEVEKAKIESHRDIALEIARKSIILLKNDGILPLSKEKKVALIGPNAGEVRNLLGDYMYLAHIRALLDNIDDVFGNPQIPRENYERLKKSIEEHMKSIPSVLDAFKEEGIEFEYAKGCEVTGEDRSGFEEAIEIAKKSDVAIVVVGDKSGLTLDCTTGESRDMANLKLPGVQEELVLEVAKTGKPVVLVLITGRPYSLKNVVDKVNAILQVWLPGEAGGRSIVDIIYGKVNPSGKLPISFPRSAGQIPVFHYVKPSGGRSHWHGDYVDESTKPLFPFGHGLSYTKFEYSNLRIEPKEVPPAGEVVIKVDVENTGDRDGDEVVQLYIGREFASVTRPVKELKGFKRVSLKAKEKKTVVFRLHMDVLAYYDRDMKLVVEPGEFRVMVGSSSEDIRLTGSFSVVGEKREVVGMRKFFTEACEE